MLFGFIGVAAMGGGLARNPNTPWKGCDHIRHQLEAVKHTLKDFRLGCEAADAWGINPKTMKAALENFKKAKKVGLGSEDFNALYKVVKEYRYH